MHDDERFPLVEREGVGLYVLRREELVELCRIYRHVNYFQCELPAHNLLSIDKDGERLYVVQLGFERGQCIYDGLLQRAVAVLHAVAVHLLHHLHSRCDGMVRAEVGEHHVGAVLCRHREEEMTLVAEHYLQRIECLLYLRLLCEDCQTC